MPQFLQDNLTPTNCEDYDMHTGLSAAFSRNNETGMNSKSGMMSGMHSKSNKQILVEDLEILHQKNENHF